MQRRHYRSVRSKLVIFSLFVGFAFGVISGIVWIYFEFGIASNEVIHDNQVLREEVEALAIKEFRGGRRHNQKEVAQHLGRSFFDDNSDILKAEMTTPSGVVLAAKQRQDEGKISGDAKEIRESVRKRKPIAKFWALKRPGDLAGKTGIRSLSPFDWRPRAQEFIAPITVGGKTIMVLHLYLSFDRLTAVLKRLLYIMGVITIVVIAAGAAVTYFALDHLVYKPISVLDEVIERITAGNIELRVPVKGNDEFTDMAERFNTMADSLIDARFRADTDAMTGSYNYRHLQNYLGAQIAMAARYNRKLTIAMLDIDYFKHVNDLYGHQTGDDVLRMTVQFIKSELRQVDYIARYGGEEFVIVLPETGPEEGGKVMERVLKGFPKNVYVERLGIKNPVFISIGVADYPFCGEDTDSLLAAADAALLLAKRRGRNQIVFSRALDQKAG